MRIPPALFAIYLIWVEREPKEGRDIYRRETADRKEEQPSESETQMHAKDNFISLE